MDYRQAREFAWLFDFEVAELMQVSLRTARKWQSENKAPGSVILCLMLLGGWIPSGDIKRTKWDGWRFVYGYLYAPNGDKFTPGDLIASRIDEQLVDYLMAKVRRLESKPKKSNVIPFPVRNKALEA